MPRKIYDPNAKVAFINAACDARKTGRPWVQAFSAAKEAGYTGSLKGIQKLLRDAGAFPKRRRAHRAPPTNGNGLRPVEQVIETVVRERVNTALDAAIAHLQRLRRS
jgi:hypothetical protein